MVLTADSSVSQTGWSYEAETAVFTPITTAGVTSSYAGRRVRYIPTTILPRATILFARVLQVDSLGNTTPWVTQQLIINT